MCTKIKKFRIVINLLFPVEISWNNLCFQSFDHMEARQSSRLSPDMYLQKKFWWWTHWINAKHRVTPSFTFQFIAQSKDDTWSVILYHNSCFFRLGHLLVYFFYMYPIFLYVLVIMCLLVTLFHLHENF